MAPSFALITLLTYAQFCIPAETELQNISCPSIFTNPEPTSTTSITIEQDGETPLTKLARDIKRKQNQIYVWYAAMTGLAGLTSYYALTTPCDEWLSGTTGSFATNFTLTTVGALMTLQDLAIMRQDYERDYQSLRRRREQHQ